LEDTVSSHSGATDDMVPTRVGPLHVRTTGTGPPALLWHSLFVDSTTWTRVEPTLATRRTLVLVDGPGHGANPPARGPLTSLDCAGAAIDVLDHFGIAEPVDWLGNAWGGHVGILFAHTYPDRCRSLMTIGTPTHALARADRWQTRLLAGIYRVTGPRPLANWLTEAHLGPQAKTDDPDGFALVADAFSRADRRGMYDATRWFSIRRRDLTPVVEQLEAPTLIATSGHDPLWTVADAQAAAGHLRHGGFVVLPGDGHIGPLLQAAPAVADVITGFWKDPDTTLANLPDRTESVSPESR
jgi:pimeloyl-ACP methyl ester carboxylesterase